MSDYSSDPTAECTTNTPNNEGVDLPISHAERAEHSNDKDNIEIISKEARGKNFRIDIGDESDHVSGQYMRNCNEMRGLLTSLLDAASDVQDEVRASISTAIFTLGRSKPYDVLLTVFNYLTSDRPKGYTQRICILQAVEEVCRDVGSDLNDHEVMEIAPLIVNEMVNSRQVIPQIQSPCSEALVGLGQSHCFQVMDILTSKFETSQLPHFFILQTMGSLATANVYTMVPFVKGILGPMLPMLNMVKHDNLKWAFAFVLARFCECVSEYLANIDKAPDPLVKKEFYSAEINTAFDVLFNSWLSSKDNKVRLQVAEAIGQMSHIMDTDKLSDWLPKLLPALLQLYKRHQEPYPVTCALALVLDASLMAGKHVLEMHMDAMLNALFQQVCATPDYTLPLTVKNHYEVLRCCDTLAKCSPEPVVGFYLSRLLHSSDRVRSSSLTVLKHLINASEFELAQKMQDIQAGLRLLLNDQSNKVKKALTQVIVALAHRGYLTQQDSALFVEFIVRQCCLPDDQTTKRVAEGDVSGESLRAMCESVLHLLSTTVEPMFPLLWPHLLEYLTADYAAALSTVLKCAGQLAERARQSQPEPDIYCGTDNPSLPRPAVLMAQLCVWLGCPECGARGQHALHLMRGIVNQINPALRPVWDAQLPLLQTRLTDEYDMESRCDWEQAVLDFISASLVAADNAEWMDQVGMAICRLLTSHQHQQHQLYHVEQPRERAFLMRCLAVCVCRQQDKQTVCSMLDTVFSATRHAHPAERKGCAQAMGIMSSVHLDTILAKLDQVARAELTKKPTGLLGFMKDTKGEAAQERMRATVVLCYGQVAQMAPHHLLGDRLEVPIYRDLQTFLPSCRTSEVRLALVTSAGELAAALHPLRLKERVRFRGRDLLLEFALSTLGVEHELSAVMVVLHAVTALIGLSPPVSGDQRVHTLRTVFGAVYPVKRELPQDHDSTLQYQLHGKVMSSLEGLVSCLLLSDFSAEVLDDLVSCLLPWTASQHVNERIHSMATLGYCLQIYLDQLGATDQDVSFSSGGQLLATLVPRCVDPELSIRPIAVDAVYTVLSVLCLCEGGRWNMDAISELKERLLNCDDASINGHLTDLAQILSEKIGANQLGAFFDTLLLGVGDRHTSSALGAAVTLTVLLRCRGAEFYERVPDILHGLHGTLSEITHQETRQEVLSAVQTLSSHHTAAVASAFLLYPLPYDDHVVDCWRVLATDERLATAVLSQFIALISSMAPYEEQRDTSSDRVLRIASLQPLAAVSALTELFGVPEMVRCCRAQEAALYVRLLSAQASYVSVFPPVAASSISGREQPAHAFVPNRSAYKLSPYRIASDALVAFLRCIDLAPLAQSVSECCGTETLEDVASYADFVMNLTSATVKQCPRLLAAMSPLVLVELSSMYETQRVAAVSFCVELVRHRGLASPPLVESLLGSLLSRLVDSSCVVRRLCLLGLGHMSALQTAAVADADFSHLVEQFAPAAMSAMLAGLDDRADSDASIPLQAMRSLTAILPTLPSEHVQHTLVPVTLRIRVYFESECTELRCGAFALFGVCAGFCQGPLRDQYLEQAHNNLVTLVVHLCDPQSAVVAACRGTLRAVASLMSGTPRIADLLQRHLCDDERLQYANFLSQLAVLMVEELLPDLGMYTMSLLAHLRSNWNELKGAAALFVAFLMCNLPADHRQNIRVQPVCCGLKKLLQDPDWHVRSQAAKAISLLHDY